ncbi:MAG TPA: fatty acid desaturase [Pirellulaceae bacterium]|nr:fatty acid desaturase [Pirellulaceae bacterium]
MPISIARPMRLESPVKEGRAQFLWLHVAVVLGLHLLSLLACVPWLFSWTGVVVCVVGLYAFGTLGINIGFHRLLAHRGFKTQTWLEHVLVTLGVCCLQGTPGRWISNHRMHHQYSDEEEDPHTPLVSFMWAHFEWLLTENKQQKWTSTYARYAPDIMRDRYYLQMERSASWLLIYVAHAAAFYAAGFIAGWLLPNGSLVAGLQLGASVLVWGVIMRTVLVWHITWSVNSLTHTSGYRNYETNDQSRNNWLVALLAAGEGWHNNHHAQPRCAAAGHRWWELDPSNWAICALALVGLATDLVQVRAASEQTSCDDSNSEDAMGERTVDLTDEIRRAA